MSTVKHDIFTLTLPQSTQEKRAWGQLYGSAQALATVEASRQHRGPVVVITDDIQHSHTLHDEIRFYLNGDKQNLFHLPDWETLPYDIFSPYQDIISERLRTLSRLPELTQGQILILPVATLLQRLTPRSYIQQHVLILEPKQLLDISQFRDSLEQAGYEYVSQVMEHGEFLVRGSIIDIFPSGSPRPYRIDLFDNEIDSIRTFDPDTQRSIDTVDHIELLPAREFPLDKEAIKQFRTRYRERFEGDPSQSNVYKDVSEGLSPAGIEYYLPLFFEQLETLFDYVPKDALFFTPSALNNDIDEFWQNLEERYEQRRHDIQRPILQPNQLYLQQAEISTVIDQFRSISTQHFEAAADHPEIQNLHTEAPPKLFIQARANQPYAALTDFIGSYQGRVLFVAESTGRRETMLEMLRDQHIQPKQVGHWSEFLACDDSICITVAPIEQGLKLAGDTICVITEPQIYGERAQQRRRRKLQQRDSEAIIRNLTDLSIGAPVVHIDHGVGRFLGLQKLNIGDIEHEFLTIEYAGNDKLYVPVSSLQLISRYTGADPEHAPLHRLGSEQWQKIKRKAAEQVKDVAAEILDIHARRAATKGQAFEVATDEYNLFAASFPFEETPDQQTAIDAVLTDMENEKPMDRVVCGDVGFGKTEVAMRAAFIAANSGKQVAILVPTTLLAQQHYQNFKDRFADWPFVIESLSRFRSKKQTDDVIKRLIEGKVDIVIGTHKLLQDDIKFDRLGLVIIDEEHRFGVRHKEKLKSMRANVDMLTLTATPIPRTLNMSLSGLRDLSIIATAPTQRHAIKTFVTEWNNSLIQEAVLREIKRGGQVYILHNDVKTIEKTANEIAELIPEARVEFAHGQMPERELEQVMLDFYHQRFNILVATTIIESGIDIPTANTIIINRADKLGLAQLHQLRGRVGRSHHRAYAYLIAPSKKAITKDAVKRLEAIESMEDLGVGFTLATHDLEIRGAGELLGEGQSGQIQEVGFTLYSELLERAVKALKSGKHPDLDKPLHYGVEIELGVAAFIPDDYIPDIQHRLIQYKRISNAKSQEELKELRIELIDRYGLLPEKVQNLFTVTELKLDIEHINIKKIDANEQGARIVFEQDAVIDPSKLIQMIQTRPQEFRFNGKDTLNLNNVTDNCIERKNLIRDTLLQLQLSEAA